MQSNDRRILHVDDDPAITKLIAKRLESFGYEVTSVNDPTEAMSELVRGQYRLVILDIDMEDKNGLELLEDIKAHDGGIQVIMLTGLVSVTTVLETLRRGAEACFFKPLDDIEPFVAAVGDTFTKIDRWWGSLNDLVRRRKSGAELTAAS
ncbi:MAG: response regulator [Planctomycetota bacterium]